MAKDDVIKMSGVVKEVFRGSRFKVELCNDEGKPIGHEINATISGRLRTNFIKILKGDKVDVELSIVDLQNGRIVWRYR